MLKTTYYVTITQPGGRVCGSIRLLGVYNLKEANQILMAQQAIFPDYSFEIKEEEAKPHFLETQWV